MLLDDVFSALDGTTKQLVSGRLLGPSGLFSRLGTTVIFTTHDGESRKKRLLVVEVISHRWYRHSNCPAGDVATAAPSYFPRSIHRVCPRHFSSGTRPGRPSCGRLSDGDAPGLWHLGQCISGRRLRRQSVRRKLLFRPGSAVSPCQTGGQRIANPWRHHHPRRSDEQASKLEPL